MDVVRYIISIYALCRNGYNFVLGKNICSITLNNGTICTVIILYGLYFFNMNGNINYLEQNDMNARNPNKPTDEGTPIYV